MHFHRNLLAGAAVSLLGPRTCQKLAPSLTTTEI